MGMVLCLRQATDETIEKLLKDPTRILPYLGFETSDPPQESRKSIWKRLFGARESEVVSTPIDTITLDEGAEEIDLDKSWHALHFLYTGSDWEGSLPESFLLTGGQTIGDVDVGYGPARAITSAEVVQANNFLTTFDSQRLAIAYDPKKLSKAKIYPDIWAREGGDDDPLTYVREYHEILTDFMQKTVAKSLGLVIHIS
jgi:hypothetical protein